MSDSNPDSDSQLLDSDPDSDSRKERWIWIHVDSDSRQVDSDPDSSCPNSHITGLNLFQFDEKAETNMPHNL